MNKSERDMMDAAIRELEHVRYSSKSREVKAVYLKHVVYFMQQILETLESKEISK